MFDIWCDHEGRRVLLFGRNITGIRNTSDAIELAYRCHCGHRGAHRVPCAAQVGRLGTAGG
jgi:hypothetical protein